MTTQPITGQTYRYVGTEPKYKGYRNQSGVAASVSRTGATWLVELSNQREWREHLCGPVIYAMATELEPVTPDASIPPLDPFTGLETDLVEDIIGALGEYGYHVCVVGQRKAKGSGTTVGYPDLSVRLPAWPRGMACLIETKTKDGAVKPKQEALHTDGWSYVVRSVAEALECMLAFERDLLLAGAVETFEREAGLEEVGA